jgi:hypothetical protein
MELKELAKIHAKNKSQLKKAISQQNLILNNAIKSENKLQEYLSIRIYLMLYTAWLETTLNLIIYYYNTQINDYDRKNILAESSQEKKWKKLIDTSFRNQYLNRKTSKNLDLVDLGHSAYNRYTYLIDLLENEITVFIGIRNKLAHGQWAVALNNEGTDKTQDITTKLWTLTKKDCMTLKNYANNFSHLIEMLVSSKSNFETNYDKYVNKIEFTKRTHSISYDWLIDVMKNKYDSYNRTPTKK